LTFRLAAKVPGIAEIGSGLWPTIAASDSIERVPGNIHVTKTGNIRHMNQEGKQSFMRLQQVAQLMPTLMARDYRHSGSRRGYKKRKGKHVKALNEEVCWNEMIGKQTGGYLSPTWAEWYMGYPEGWTNIEDSE
jgi:hypothetical protein